LFAAKIHVISSAKDKGGTMPRIQGVDIPNDKFVYISLSYLYGVGPKVALRICHQLGIDPCMKASQLSDDNVAKINNYLDREILAEGQLRRAIQQDIGRLKDIKSYRGMRHRRNLPVRGQRTRTNARTRKGVKKTVAGKKGVKDMKH
jgi:small subunit ribosomal protein S13